MDLMSSSPCSSNQSRPLCPQPAAPTMPSPDMVYGALPPPGCDPSGLGEALPAQSRPSPFRPAAPKAGPPGEHGPQALGQKGVGIQGGLVEGSWLRHCLSVCITSGPQTSLDYMATCPLSGGFLLLRPGTPSLLTEPPCQQDTTTPVPGSRWAEARPAC